MTRKPTSRALALVALASVVAAVAEGSAFARPDPDSGPSTWSTAGQEHATESVATTRPTGPAKHASLNAAGSAGDATRASIPQPAPLPAVAGPQRPDAGWFDWRSAGLGAGGTALVLALAAGAARRRSAAATLSSPG